MDTKRQIDVRGKIMTYKGKHNKKQQMSSTVRFPTLYHVSTFIILYVIVLFNKLSYQIDITS